MAQRIDANGYFLTPDGRPDFARSQDQAHWQKVIHDSWVAAHGKEPMPTDYTIAVVEKGDCQWTIAEDVGADPVQTAYTINKQFADPDMIMPNQVVFLPPSTHYAVDRPLPGQAGPARDNAEIFARQTFDHTSKASVEGQGNFQPIKNDIHTYLDSVMALPDQAGPNGTPSDRDQALRNLLVGPSWGSNEEGAYGRDLILQNLLSRPGMNTPEAVKDLEKDLGLGYFNEHGEFIEKTPEQFEKEIRADPQDYDVRVNGKVDDGLVKQRVQERVDLQNDIKSNAKQLGIKVNW